MKTGTLSMMRSRVLSAIKAHGVWVKEDNGRLVELCADWAAPLVMCMSKSACNYVLLGINGRKSHAVVLSRRLVSALQRFSGQYGIMDLSTKYSENPATAKQIKYLQSLRAQADLEPIDAFEVTRGQASDMIRSFTGQVVTPADN